MEECEKCGCRMSDHKTVSNSGGGSRTVCKNGCSECS